MPLFNHETAVAAGLKSGEARRARRFVPLSPAVERGGNVSENHFVQDTFEDLQRCSEFLKNCKDPKLFVQLTAAKERLWNLVLPKAGVRKPSRHPQIQAPSLTSATPVPLH